MGSVYWYAILTTAMVNILLTSSLRTIYLLGRISLGQVGFMLIGAYVSALLVMRVGMSFWIGLVLGGLAAAAVALLLSYPFLRAKGVYFAMLTLLTAESLRLVVFYAPRSLTGASGGLPNIPGPGHLLGINLGTLKNSYYLAVAIVTLSLLVLYALERSDVGLKWRAIRDAENLAESVGVKVLWYKTAGFVVACFFAGVAGALFAHIQGGLSVEATSRFGVVTSLYLLVYMAVGGAQYFSGPVVGALLLTVVTQLAGSLKEYQPIFVGVVAILFALLLPTGLAAVPGRLFRRKDRRPADSEQEGVERAAPGD